MDKKDLESHMIKISIFYTITYPGLYFIALGQFPSKKLFSRLGYVWWFKLELPI